jgi:hypothetical protein
MSRSKWHDHLTDASRRPMATKAGPAIEAALDPSENYQASPGSSAMRVMEFRIFEAIPRLGFPSRPAQAEPTALAARLAVASTAASAQPRDRDATITGGTLAPRSILDSQDFWHRLLDWTARFPSFIRGPSRCRRRRSQDYLRHATRDFSVLMRQQLPEPPSDPLIARRPRDARGGRQDITIVRSFGSAGDAL